jgi:outer membrane protein OmpA-like peptidoglycan-associated protein/tetratricopeptide (TPR) repeat protein
MKLNAKIAMLALAGLLCLGGRAQAQTTGAHDEYLHHSYQEAIRKYKAQVDKHPDDGELLFNLADSYRRNGQMKEAENWFAQALQHSDDSRAHLYYAQVLLSNRKYAQAKTAFLEFAGQAVSESDAANARQIAATCEKLALEGPQPTGVHVQKADFNSQQLDFSPRFWKEGSLVFASNRAGSTGPTDEPDPWTEDAFVDLWMVDVAADGKTGTPRPFAKELNSRYHEGPMAFAGDGNTLLFTRSDLQGNTHRGYDDAKNTRLKIYAATWTAEKWVVGTELSMNNSQFSTCHPALSPTEDTLVFASDRPGGYGGMDLWYATRQGKDWSEPHNLGPEINTAGNEVFPFVHADGSLYFSSDFMVGYGGLDLFSAPKTYEGWGRPENMGAPINSSLDDYGIAVAADKQHGHFSSNRSGSGDDIYSYLDMAHIRIPVTVVDCETGRALPGVQVMVGGPENRVFTADAAGQVMIPAQAGKDYQLQAYGEGYYGPEGCDGKASIHVPSKGNERLPMAILRLSQKNPCCFSFADPEKTGSSIFQYQWSTGDGRVETGRNVSHCYEEDGTYVAQLEIVDPDFSNIVKYTKTVTVTGCQAVPQGPLVVEGVLRDKLLGTPLPFAAVDLVNKCSGKTTTWTTDSTGHYQFVLPGVQDCDFWLIGKKQGFATQHLPLTVAGRKSSHPLHQDMDLDPERAMLAGNAVPNVQMLPQLPMGYVYVTPINLPVQGGMPTEASFTKPIAQGDVIELYNIYFDFGKYNIRPDAETDLQFLLQLLRKYPHMQGELSAHTDSRSSDAYNLHLSQQRARAGFDWLVARGVDPQRLSTRGYGEYQLRNQCGDDVYCNEVEHQRNRRVEFRVTYFDGVINSKEYEYYLPRTMNAAR